MKVLLTGKSGFIGRHLHKYLSGCSWVSELHSSVRRIEDKDYEFDHVLDLTDRFATKSLLTQIKPDAIVHFAAIPTTQPNNDNPTLITVNNIVSTHNLCHYAPEGCRFVNASSVLVYGKFDKNYRKSELSRLSPISVYGATKLAGEHYIDAYSNMNRINGISIRASAVVGLGLTHGLLLDIFKKLYSDSEKLELLGENPGSIKPFTHVHDVCRTVHFLLNNIVGKTLKGCINLCPSDELSVKEIAEIVMNITGRYKEVEFLGKDSLWIGDNNYVGVDGKLLTYFGFDKKYPTSRISIETATKEIHEALYHNK